MTNELRIKGMSEDVHVVGSKRISRWLLSQRQTLAPEEVEAIYSIARNRSTWVEGRYIRPQGSTITYGV
jgi:hypothetical protein